MATEGDLALTGSSRFNRPCRTPLEERSSRAGDRLDRLQPPLMDVKQDAVCWWDCIFQKWLPPQGQAAQQSVCQSGWDSPIRASAKIGECAYLALSPAWAISPLKVTFVPFRTIEARSSASQFVSLMQPCEKVLPILPGSGVP